MKKLKQAFIFWLARLLPTCEDITSMASLSMDQKLALRERIRLRLHLFICIWCQRYMDQLLFIRKTAREESRTPNESTVEIDTPLLSDEARERIKRNLVQ